MPDRMVESAAAEQAKTDIRLMHDEYRVASTLQRHRRGRIRTDHLAERPQQLLVASIVGVVEHLSLDVLIGRGVAENKARTWDGQVKEWNGLGVDMTAACPSLAAVRGFYEARTAIMHAGGHFTSGQLVEPRHTTMLGHLASAGVEHAQHRVLVDDSTIVRCVEICLRFIDELEALRVP
ncbi:MAG: hypothetical protein ACRCYU_15645 [Nocardioides sp.]